jgi:hypothetical protein
VPFLADIRDLHLRLRRDVTLHDTQYDPPFCDLNFVIDNYGAFPNVTVGLATCRIKFRYSKSIDPRPVVEENPQSRVVRNGYDFFYALRSVALGKWDDDALKTAETSMIAATGQLIHVDGEMRDQWFDFWQRAQEIRRVAAEEPDVEKRPGLIKMLIDKKVQTKSGPCDLRELHNRLERTGRSAADLSP